MIQVRTGDLDDLNEAGMEVMCRILMESQEFMRKLAVSHDDDDDDDDDDNDDSEDDDYDNEDIDKDDDDDDFLFVCAILCVQDECSFVSLRDVDRALTVVSWFVRQANHSGTLFNLLDRKMARDRDAAQGQEEEDSDEEEEEVITDS
jgi:hypothetical protein